jgi:hypothetical protein
MQSEVIIKYADIKEKLHFILSLSNTHTNASSTQHTTKIVINEICRLITMGVKDLYVNTQINAMLHITELLLTINNTTISVQQITLLLHRVLKQYYFHFSYNFQTYEKFFHGIHYFSSGRRDISPTVETFNSKTYDRN